VRGQGAGCKDNVLVGFFWFGYPAKSRYGQPITMLGLAVDGDATSFLQVKLEWDGRLGKSNGWGW